MTRLTVYVGGERCGWFTQRGNRVDLEYSTEWLERRDRLELSLAMRRSRREYRGDVPVNWLWGLLPDSDAVLERWGRRFGVSPRNPFALLKHVGLDAAGAVQLTERDEPSLEGPAGFDIVSEAEIGEHLAELRRDPSAWLFARERHGYFSLAGAQAKFALAWTKEGWAVPTGRAASTHIIKPGIAGLASSDLGEHLALDAARRLGLETVRSRIHQFGEESAIVVERYDRQRSGSAIVRLHQEDLVQAAGLHPALKYQADGGPGIAGVGRVLREAARTSLHATDMIERFFDANLFNLVMAGTDAHAKNYAVLLTDRGVDLAPFYDMQSILGHERMHERDIKLAMSIDGHYRAWEIQSRHVQAAAASVGLDGERAVARAIELAESVAAAFSDAVASSGASTPFTRRLIDSVASHAERVRSRLVVALGRSSASIGGGRRQPRSGGRFAAGSSADGSQPTGGR